MVFKLLIKVNNFSKKYPVLRGMAAYSLIWPCSNFCQQSMDKTRSNVDLKEVLRYFTLGTFVTAPTVHVWIKTLNFFVKGKTLPYSMLKGVLDVIIFAPIGHTQFYLGISALEGKPWSDCMAELQKKFLPTWKVAACFWPFVQTINFTYVPERNRVIFVSMASFMWTIFLSYMHHSKFSFYPINEKSLKISST